MAFLKVWRLLNDDSTNDTVIVTDKILTQTTTTLDELDTNDILLRAYQTCQQSCTFFMIAYLSNDHKLLML